MKADKIILGVLGGVAVGALLGVLFAPDKGTETRKKIAEKGNEIKDQVADLIDVVASRLESSADDIDDYVEKEYIERFYYKNGYKAKI